MINWQWRNFSGINYLTIPQWERLGANILFTSRYAGKSSGPYSSLNLALHVGDEKAPVLENRRDAMKIFGRAMEDMVCCQQVHGDNIAVAGKADQGKGAWEYDDSLSSCDAMITDDPGLYLTLFYADCLPVYLFDPVKKNIALIHCGWKGTMKKIVTKTIEKMAQCLASNPADIQAFIGPGISKCCFKISGELAESVKREFGGLDDILFHNDGQYSWDLARTNYHLLLAAGLLEQNIAVCELCTGCRADLFFSYRRDAGITGRMAALIGLK